MGREIGRWPTPLARSIDGSPWRRPIKLANLFVAWTPSPSPRGAPPSLPAPIGTEDRRGLRGLQSGCCELLRGGPGRSEKKLARTKRSGGPLLVMGAQLPQRVSWRRAFGRSSGEGASGGRGE